MRMTELSFLNATATVTSSILPCINKLFQMVTELQARNELNI